MTYCLEKRDQNGTFHRMVLQKRGEIDLRAIAPTVAKIMNANLPTATGKPLS